MFARALTSLFGLSLVAFALGCGNSEPTPAIGPPTTPGPAVGAAPSGNEVFDKNCLHCHAYSMAIPGPPRSGPTLAKVGSAHTRDWIAEHVKNPKSHKPESKMPEFAAKLNAEELKSVTDYLAGLK